MAKATIPHWKITANPSQLVDCPPASERTRLAAPHKIEEGQSDMQMMQPSQFQPAYEFDAADALSLIVPKRRLAPTQAWDDAVETWRQTDAARRAYGEEIFDPAWDAAQQQRQTEERELQRQIDEIPHYTTVLSHKAASGTRHMSTGNPVDVRAAMVFHGYDDEEDFTLCCRELVRGIGHRFAAEQEIRDRFEFSHDGPFDPAIDAEMKRLEQLDQPAWDAVIRFPAVTLGDLVAKVEFLQSQECDVDHAELLTDLTRIWNVGQPVKDINDVANWQEAMGAYTAAKDAYERDRSDELCNAMIDAEYRLRRMRAPDLDAIEWKILSLQVEAEDATLGQAEFDVILGDLRKLRTAEAPGAAVSEISVATLGDTPFMSICRQFMAAYEALNAAGGDDEGRLGEAYHAVFRVLIETRPSNDREFRLKFLALWGDGGAPNEEIVASMVKDAGDLSAL
ncbi:hypothetical protein [Sphingobium sp. YR657]|uniref:hypothetical protein n=2 Tax=unclassified Sphingobium TaxID=2611147 RepID=UPI0031379BF6